ncbi:uncharacterized protein LOC129356471 [Poeciliopsis prolifica]|uniref:uncharacterized protein LOC129356471 n=1 Tax=Poeciliopsis prolifica TaxID=188132 RepID=UPI002413E502|nr:uncharacterized protein LOC129356471 [Poeciliopsis prolifica]XP_054882037.1 uncharacterized protein LOC129356471 [Poeciliopsis prolifica]
MAQLSWIQGFLFIILQLTVTADETSVIKREGDEVMLSCPKLIDGQRKCRNTTWSFAHSKTSSSVELVLLGQINNYKPDRLSLTSDCSLVIKKVREEDAGQYHCQQWGSAFRQSTVNLSVVHLTEQTENQRATLSCSVVTFNPCGYKVQWFYQEMNNKESSSGRGCSATVTLSSGFRFAQCKVTQTGTDEELSFSLQPSVEHASSFPPTSNTTQKKPENASISPVISVAVVSLIVLITAVVIIIWRATGKKTKPGEKDVELEDDVYYSTIRNAEETKGNAQFVKHDAVSCSTVEACSSSAAASDDPNKIYSLISSIN